MCPSAIIDELIEIIKFVKPKEIWLFGSYAKNEESINSDIDIFVVKKNIKKSTHKKLVKVRNGLNKFTKKYGIEVDLFINSIEEINKKLNEQNAFYLSVFSDGKKIYSKEQEEFLQIPSKRDVKAYLLRLRRVTRDFIRFLARSKIVLSIISQKESFERIDTNHRR